MHRVLLLVIDVLLVAAATMLALVIRENFDVPPSHWVAFWPYLVATVAASVAALWAFGTNQAIWRFTTFADYPRLLAATLAIVFGAVALTFAYNRLEGLARALPVMQAILVMLSLTGSRVLLRLRHAARGKSAQMLKPGTAVEGDTVLVVGVSRLSDLYLQAVAELTPNQFRIAGLLSPSGQHGGRLVQNYPVLGTPEQVAGVLKTLEVHGMFVTRIVVASAFSRLTAEAQAALLAATASSGIRLELIAESLGLSPKSLAPALAPQPEVAGPSAPVAFVIEARTLSALARRPYWRVKRVLDFVCAAALLVLSLPLVVLVSVLVAFDVGFPLAFWQQRPGLGGRPFKLYKLRTMAAAHGPDGKRVADRDRLSGIGKFLRRTRLDELPQLINILRGEMSFVGPRPLLPVDQPAEFAARLMVRPGLTGWAQVRGGRDVSAADKAALDVWYVHQASWALDLEVLLRTVPMVLFGEQVDAVAIRQAWRDLEQAGVVAGKQVLARQVNSERPLVGTKFAA